MESTSIRLSGHSELVAFQQGETSITLPQAPKPFFNLSTDVLLMLSDYLWSENHVSAAAFSVCCKAVYLRLCNHYTRDLVGADKLALLELLAIDLPNQIACSRCLRLHDMANVTKYNTGLLEDRKRQRHAFKSCDVQLFQHFYHLSFSDFSSTVFKMAMKRHQFNPGCDELLRILSSNPPALMIDPKRGIIKHRNINCRIFNGCMIHRVRQSFLLCNSPRYIFPRKKETDQLIYFEVCEHLTIILDLVNAQIMDWSRTYHTRVIWKTMMAGVWSLRPSFNGIQSFVKLPAQIHKTSGPLQCYHCPTECRLDLEYHKDRGTFATATKWANLGTGPQDWRYLDRTRRNYFQGSPVLDHMVPDQWKYSVEGGKRRGNSSYALNDDEDGGAGLGSSDEIRAKFFQAQDYGVVSGVEQLD